MDIEILINFYNERISLIEKELAEMKHKRDILQEAFEAFNKDKNSDQKIVFQEESNIPIISNKYSNMTWPQALLLALTDNGEMTGEQLLKELFENGFQSNSKSTKSDMYGRLKTLENNGKIISTKKGKGLKKYKIKQDEEEIDSDPHMAGPESIENHGGLGERSKPAVL